MNACENSDEEDDCQGDKTTSRAADGDAETTEDVEAADRLQVFLNGRDRGKATAPMLFDLAKNDLPFSWGSVRLEVIPLYVNALSVLTTRAVLSESLNLAVTGGVPSVPELEDA